MAAGLRWAGASEGLRSAPTASSRSAGHCPAERDFAALWRALLQADDTAELLQLAHAALDLVLAEMPSSENPPGSVDLETVQRRPVVALRSEAQGLPEVLRLLAPWLAGEGSVLRRICPPAASASPLALSLFGVSASSVVGRPFEEGFTMLAAACGAAIPGADESLRSPSDPATSPCAEALFIRLALSCFPVGRLPEILGYALAEAQDESLLLSWLDGLFTSEAARPAYSNFRSRRTALLARRRPVLEQALAVYQADSAGAARMDPRVERGRWLHRALEQRVGSSLERVLARADDPAGQLGEMLRRKAPYAKGYHGRVRVGGRTLDDWFGDQPFDPGALLTALAASDWVDRRRPDDSRMLRLFEFGGPMFGVFSVGEQTALASWIASLRAHPEPATEIAPEAAAGLPAVGIARGESIQSAPPQEGVPATVETTRTLFHRLLNLEDHPEVLASAAGYVDRCLGAAAQDWTQWRTRFRYGRSAFEAWVNRCYRNQMQQPAAPRARPRLSREAYRFGIEQLAPAILVDGCWLQRAEDLMATTPAVARRLAAIHADELGCGIPERSHPLIYRRLLESLQIDLPPVAGAAFAAHTGFVDAAFDLPAFLLSISLAPRRFLPELLGLNLAIELSGLGASYSGVARELEFWGIDSQIIRLHQSIDNPAGGHAALARDAIVLHLEEVGALGGERSVQQHWVRVWCGYHALRTVTRRFKRALVLRYIGRMAGRKLGLLPAPEALRDARNEIA